MLATLTSSPPRSSQLKHGLLPPVHRPPQSLCFLPLLCARIALGSACSGSPAPYFAFVCHRLENSSFRAPKALRSFRTGSSEQSWKRSGRGSGGGGGGRGACFLFNIMQRERGGGRIKVVVISGPTAVGKSAMAEVLAKADKLDAELVSADSVQVYKGMDIGSNKPTAEEQAQARYHLLDVVDPTEEYNAADFTQHARAAIADISARGKLPIVVGGTGFYLQWLVFGRPGAPKPSEEAEEKARSAIGSCEGSWERASELFRSLDERYFDGLSANDWLRLQRLLEVWYTTGKGMSSFDRPQGKSLSPEEVSRALSCTDLDFRCFFLHRSRLEIFRDIDLRCELMLKAGFLEEVDVLVRAGKLRLGPGVEAVAQEEHLPAERAIGYRQALDFLWRMKGRREEGAGREELDKELESFIREFQSVSRQFVRRQLTWFRSDPVFRWVQATDRGKAVEELEVAIRMEERDFLQLYDDEDERRKQEEARKSESSKEEQKLLRQYISQLTIYKDADSRSALLDSILAMEVVQ